MKINDISQRRCVSLTLCTCDHCLCYWQHAVANSVAIYLIYIPLDRWGAVGTVLQAPALQCLHSSSKVNKTLLCKGKKGKQLHQDIKSHTNTKGPAEGSVLEGFSSSCSSFETTHFIRERIFNQKQMMRSRWKIGFCALRVITTYHLISSLSICCLLFGDVSPQNNNGGDQLDSTLIIGPFRQSRPPLPDTSHAAGPALHSGVCKMWAPREIPAT